MLLKQDSNGSRDMLSKQSSASDSISRQDSQISYIEPRKGILCKQDTQISYIEHSSASKKFSASLSSQDSVLSIIEHKRHKLVKQDSIFSFNEPKSGKQQPSHSWCPRTSPARKSTTFPNAQPPPPPLPLLSIANPKSACLELANPSSWPLFGARSSCPPVHHHHHQNHLHYHPQCCRHERRTSLLQPSTINQRHPLLFLLVVVYENAAVAPPNKRHQLVKQHSVISFADQKRGGSLTKQDSVTTIHRASNGDGPYISSILKKTDSQCSSASPIRKNIGFFDG